MSDSLKIRIQARHLRAKLLARHGESSYLARVLGRLTDSELVDQARQHHEWLVEHARASAAGAREQ